MVVRIKAGPKARRRGAGSAMPDSVMEDARLTANRLLADDAGRVLVVYGASGEPANVYYEPDEAQPAATASKPPPRPT